MAFGSVALFTIFLMLLSSTDACSQSELVNTGFSFVPRTSKLKETHAYGMDWRFAHPNICPMLCINYNNINRDVKCTGILLKPTGNSCFFLIIAPESLTTFNKSKTDQKIYVIEKYINSISNYRLFGLGEPANLSFTSFFGPTTQIGAPFTNLWSQVYPLRYLISYLDHAGTNFNLESRIILTCGGIQGGSILSLSENCWSLKTDPMEFYFSEPIKMLQPREYPTLVSVGIKTYIFGGNVSDPAKDSVEAYDPNSKSISKVVSELPQSQFLGLLHPCGITLNDEKAMVVTGGLINNTILSTTGIFYVNLGFWSSLASLNTARYNHGCGKVLRHGRDFLIVYGGAQSAGSLSSIELFDLSNKNSLWIESQVSLPVAMGNIIGHVATVFDEKSCELMVIDLDIQALWTCKFNYLWTQRNVSKNSEQWNGQTHGYRCFFIHPLLCLGWQQEGVYAQFVLIRCFFIHLLHCLGYQNGFDICCCKRIIFYFCIQGWQSRSLCTIYIKIAKI